MSYITVQQIRERFEQARRQSNVRTFSASTVLNEGRQISDSTKTFDIFLSHSSDDNEFVAGIKLILEDFGFTVYVDWNDPALNPNRVTQKTAAILRERMSHCRSLVYAYSGNAQNSRWMPWELGYFDGLKSSMVAVLPISRDASKSIQGSEYVGLYYAIDIDTISNTNRKALWVNNGLEEYVNFKDWLKGIKPYRH